MPAEDLVEFKPYWYDSSLLHSNFQSWQMRSLPTLDPYVCLVVPKKWAKMCMQCTIVVILYNRVKNQPKKPQKQAFKSFSTIIAKARVKARSSTPKARSSTIKIGPRLGLGPSPKIKSSMSSKPDKFRPVASLIYRPKKYFRYSVNCKVKADGNCESNMTSQFSWERKQ